MSRSPFTVEQRAQAVEDYLSGKRSNHQIRQDLGIANKETVRQWVISYQEQGIEAFVHNNRNAAYSKEFKLKVVEEYMDGKGSLSGLAAKYKICSIGTLHMWVMKYNSNIELKDYDPKQEVYMATAKRKTCMNERVKIVEHCINHNNDYKGTAEKYDVSYSQVYLWVKKYNETGEKGLTDKRGNHKADEEVDELEKLQREIKQLKRQLEEEKMTVELLKKVKEFEGRRYSPKGS
jgi:transposase-like protein